MVFESGAGQTKGNSYERTIGVTSCDRLAHMTDYLVYVIGSDDHPVMAMQPDCADDNTAIESAKKFANGRGVELWQHERIVVKLGRNRDGQ